MILLILAALINASAHEFYLSTANVEYNLKSHRFEVIIRVFTDDFEATLTRIGGAFIDLSDSRHQKRQIIPDYLTNSFEIRLNAPIKLTYLGLRYGRKSISLYLESEPVNGVGFPVTIRNEMLIADFPDQVNMTHVMIGEHRRSALCDRTRTTVLIRFK